jgi:hypothetical protein
MLQQNRASRVGLEMQNVLTEQRQERRQTSGRSWFIAIVLGLMAWVLVGCNAPQTPPDVEGPPVSMEEAVEMVRPLEAKVEGGGATPAPTVTSTPSFDPTSTPTVVPETRVDVCADTASFVEDVTVPDGAELHPGELFTKVWRLKNSGNCPWTVEYGAEFISGDQLAALPNVPIKERVEPGEYLDLSIQMRAPIRTGSYRGTWMLHDPSGETFGEGEGGETAFWVQIEVVEQESTALATPVAEFPAAGICPEVDGSIVTMIIRPDIPDPRCMIIQPDQRLRVVNDREITLEVALGRLTATLDPGESVTFDVPFGDLLLAGVHPLLVDPCCGGSLWLQE